jgi:hypothetical protein
MKWELKKATQSINEMIWFCEKINKTNKLSQIN